ncbi:EsaB/YukD family protein [Pseudobutyrivibrio sp.]|jgi:uncharacterized ubiquitin-like protein YukD|uniref:EsaB/YukD family protein n=1 Tax=Pseudobutyrivibrio sp. TaxID=2014367 RepID=UPI001D63E394|nr:EsaB/YukD family protein [Pseudobutyrivibrio sp.]MBE5910376.1 hypothetical protein [Pseudobutyrivibrio sp.]
MEKAIVILKLNNGSYDLETPVNITANEFIYGVSQAFNLGIDMDNPDQCFLRMENPIGLLRGDNLLDEFGVRNGSIIYCK